jgi:hypothetical protein
MDIDLELVPTDDLIEELFSRFDAGVLSLIQDRGAGDSVKSTGRFSGDDHLIQEALTVLAIKMDYPDEKLDD